MLNNLSNKLKFSSRYKNPPGEIMLLYYTTDYFVTPNNKTINWLAKQIRCLTYIYAWAALRSTPASLQKPPFNKKKLLLLLQTGTNELPFIFWKANRTKLQDWKTEKKKEKPQAPARVPPGGSQGHRTQNPTSQPSPTAQGTQQQDPRLAHKI